MIKKRFVVCGLALVAVVALVLSFAMYLRHDRLQAQHDELRYRVTYYCENLQRELRFAADQYGTFLAALANRSGSDLLRAEIVVDETPTDLGGDSTRSGRAATAAALQRRFNFCSGLRGESADVDALRARFIEHKQAYWQSTDRSAIHRALADMAKDAAELRLR